MKSILLCLSLLLITVHSNFPSDSQVYRCASELGIDKLCTKAVEVEPSNFTIYVAGCPEGEYCPFGEEAYCTKKTIPKEEGETCQRTSECKSKMCVEGKCSTLPDGAECLKHYQCGQFSSCSDSVCKPLLKEGDSCESDYDCGFDLACGNGKCQKMFSLETGEVSDNLYLCKSGYVNKIITSEGEKTICMNKIRNTPTCEENFEKSCNFTLTTEEGVEMKISEYCQPNWDFRQYCDHGTDFFLWNEFLELYQKITKEIDPTKIKVTEARAIMWDIRIGKAYTTNGFYSRIKGADKCVFDYFGMNYVKEQQMKYFLE